MTSALQTMSQSARIKLDQRIAERAAAATKSKSLSSSHIRLKDAQSFKAIFTSNAEEQMVDFSRDGTSQAVKWYNYEVLLLEYVDGNKIQANNETTTFSASKITSQAIDNLLKNGFQRLPVSGEGSDRTDAQYAVTLLIYLANIFTKLHRICCFVIHRFAPPFSNFFYSICVCISIRILAPCAPNSISFCYFLMP